MLAKKRRKSTAMDRVTQWLRPLIVIGFIAIFVLGAFQSGVVTTTTTAIPPTTTDQSAQGGPHVMPTVPPGGLTLTTLHTYFHPTGLMSLPLITGWDLPGQNPENTTDPSTTGGFGRIEATFINNSGLSVIHAFAEKDPKRTATTTKDLDKYYTKEALDGAWRDYTGGWRELDRGVVGDTFVINFELKVKQGSTAMDVYLARQVTRLDQSDWLLTLRLVVPDNNPQLLDQLQNKIMPQFRFWPQGLIVPVSWASIADWVVGYVVKFPPDWGYDQGSPGQPYKVSGKIGADTYSLSTQNLAVPAIKAEADARAWFKTTYPNATIQKVKAETLTLPGFSISYTDPDADGNQHSSIVTLLNDPNGSIVYVLNVQSTTHGLDFLDDANTAVSPEIALIRKSFFLVSRDMLLATATPTPSSTPVPTAVTTAATTVTPVGTAAPQ